MFFITQAANAPTTAATIRARARNVTAANAASRRLPANSAANIIQDCGYTPVRMPANAVSAFSQAHTENRVYRNGKPVGAIFICGVS